MPGWYLIAANSKVEAGPFRDQAQAEGAARWMDDQALGVNPLPYVAVEAPRGLIIGSRYRTGRRGGNRARVSA